MASKTLKDLFENQLQDAYSAETQIVKALPKMAKAATNPKLKAGFEQHLLETKNQVSRLEQACKIIGCKPSSNTCEATEGLVKEGEEIIAMGLNPEATDAGLLLAGQKVEHYEIALYGGLCAFAKQLGHADVAKLLHETLEEEKATNTKLNTLAEQDINPKALKASA